MTRAAKDTPLCLSILSPDWLTSLHTRGLEGARRALETPSAQA